MDSILVTLLSTAGGLSSGPAVTALAAAILGRPSPRAAGCPRCGRRRSGYRLLPVLGVWPRRCPGCGAPSSPLWTAGEALAGVLVWTCTSVLGPGLPGLSAAVFCLVLLLAALTDLAEKVVPETVLLLASALAVAAAPWIGPGPGSLEAAAWSLAGALAVGGTMQGVRLVYRLVRGREGMGRGDVELGLLLGAFLGLRHAWLALCLGLLPLTALAWLPSLRSRDTTWPLAPFLAWGGALTALFRGALP